MATADGISNYKFEWIIDSVTETGKVSKGFVMRIFSHFEVVCVAYLDKQLRTRESGDVYDQYSASEYMQFFQYELKWLDTIVERLQYSSHISLHGGKKVLVDKKDSAQAVCSSDFATMGSFVSQVCSGSIKIEFVFKFNLAMFRPFRDRLIPGLTLPILTKDSPSDVVVTCGGKTFHCHLAVLVSHSEFFEKTFIELFKEGKDEIDFEIEGFKHDVFWHVIRFMYKKEVPEEVVSWELFDAAKFFNVHGLQAKCLGSLRKNLSLANCCAMLEAAFKHDLDDTFHFAMGFVNDNKAAVTRTEGWKAVDKNQPLLNKILFHFTR